MTPISAQLPEPVKTQAQVFEAVVDELTVVQHGLEVFGVIC